MPTSSRRRFLASALSLSPLARAQAEKPIRGIFPIMSTPFTESKAVDFEDLAREVEFLDQCGVHGMVWPQLASEYTTLTKPERRRGMEVIAKAAKGRRPVLVLGVQGPNAAAALEYLEHAESLAPDALIAIPPTDAASAEDYRQYYRALGAATRRPLFVQTTGGARGIIPDVEMLVEVAREFPHLGHVKEEAEPVIPRMKTLASHWPVIRRVFSGGAGRGLLYERRLGLDGTMPGAPYSDVYVAVWDAWEAGRRAQAGEIFGKLLRMINLDQVVPGARPYIMKKRGVFKAAVSRRQPVDLTPEAIAEIDFHFEALKPYLKGWTVSARAG